MSGELKCNFCGREPKEVRAMITSSDANICNECTLLSLETMQDCGMDDPVRRADIKGELRWLIFGEAEDGSACDPNSERLILVREVIAEHQAKVESADKPTD